MRFTFKTLALFAFSSISFSQGNYPLRVGNQWDYGEIDFHTPGQYAYLYSVRIIGDTTMPNGINYAIEKTGYGTRFLRQADSRVLLYDSTKENVLYDLSLQDGDTASIVRSGPYVTLVIVRLGQVQMFGESQKSWTYIRTSNESSDGGSRTTIVDSIGHTYTFIDGGYTEYLMGALINGRQFGTITRAVAQDNTHPSECSLYQNYPNPFNPSTSIRYALPHRNHVNLSVFNTLGQQVAILVNETQDAGYHDVRFDASGLASGVYFYRLSAGEYVETKRLLIIR